MTPILQSIIEIVWLLLPAGIANSMVTVAARYRWVPLLMRPVDHGVSWRGRRLFGANKTYQGFFIAIIFGSIVVYIQHLLQGVSAIQEISLPLHQQAFSAIAFGAALGFAALTADAVKSFFKRQIGIAPGKPWQPFDQIDSTLGALVVIFFVTKISIIQIVSALVIFGFGTYFVSFIGVKSKIKKSL